MLFLKWLDFLVLVCKKDLIVKLVLMVLFSFLVFLKLRKLVVMLLFCVLFILLVLVFWNWLVDILTRL